MALTREQFDALVARLDVVARQSPLTYRLRVGFLALLGSIYLGTVLLTVSGLFLMLLVSTIWLKALALKLAIVVGVFLWLVVRALWVKIPPPEGREIVAADAPELFAMIDELRLALRSPRFHHVLMTDEFNAGVVQSPRLGLLGWYRNYLLIGLPLMKSLSVVQFKAVLAHEFGHLSRNHGRMSNWIYRQRLRWARLMAILDASQSRGGFLFLPFFNWYSPYFSAYSFPLARANEYAADATAAQLTSPQAASEALTAVNVVGSYLAERYWPRIHKLADEQPQPNFAPYSGMQLAAASDLDQDSLACWLEQATARKTTSDDTHPALADRLQAIGASPSLALPATGQAAEILLGEGGQQIVEAFDARWHEAIRASWEERYRRVQDGRRRLTEFDERLAAGEELPIGEALERVRLLDSVADDDDLVMSVLRELQGRVPDNAFVLFSLGVRLLRNDADDGIGLLEEAVRLDDDGMLQVCEVLYGYFVRHGRAQEADLWRGRYAERQAIEQAAWRERNAVYAGDVFLAHDLTSAELDRLRAELAAIPGLRKAYLAQKQVVYFPHRCCLVFGFSVIPPWRFQSAKRIREMTVKINTAVSFPLETIIFCMDGDNSRFGKKLRRVDGSRVL